VREGQELENPKTVAEIGVDLKLSCNRVPQMAGQGTFPAREVLEKQTGKELGKYHLPQKNEGLSWAFVQPLYLSQGSLNETPDGLQTHRAAPQNQVMP
jgi:hypothetical protein